MRRFCFAFSAVALAATPAFALDDSAMASRIGNTVAVESTLGDAHLYFRADHTFTGTGSLAFVHLSLEGIWKLDGGDLCLTYDSPPPGESNPDCSPLTAHKVGDSWDYDGRKVTLVKGIQ
jgi:hypothetical protein